MTIADRVRISVGDNGAGIPTENLRVFNHGFTTKRDGHGFGLHSGANAAKEMGGDLSVHSAGIRRATFTFGIARSISRSATMNKLTNPYRSSVIDDNPPSMRISENIPDADRGRHRSGKYRAEFVWRAPRPQPAVALQSEHRQSAPRVWRWCGERSMKNSSPTRWRLWTCACRPAGMGLKP